MRYAPHVVRAGSGSFEGIIDAVHPVQVTPSAKSPVAYPIFVTVSLVGVPYDRRIHRARFMGSLRTSYLNNSSVLVDWTQVRSYDDMITKYREDVAGHSSTNLAPVRPAPDNLDRAKSVQGWLETYLVGRHVQVLKTGGRWIAQ